MAEHKTITDRVCAVMAEAKAVRRDSSNRFAKYDYASADAVYDAVRPLLAKHGLGVRHEIEPIEKMEHRGVEFLILPIGVWLESTDGAEAIAHYRIPLNTSGQKGVRLDPQVIQAATTYAVKYFIRSRFLLNTGDPDADAAQPQEVPATETKQAPPDKPKSADGELVLDGNKLVRSDGQDIMQWIEAAGRAASTAVYIYANRVLSEKQGQWQAVIAENMPVWKAAIPHKGRLVIGNTLKATDINPTAIEQLLDDAEA